MIHPYVWGTHLEVKAAATLYQIPIYFCTQPTQNGPFSWSVVQPISPEKISFPMIVDEEFNEKDNITHIEMYHHHCHYDVIASIESDKICEVLPQLTGEKDSRLIDLC